MIIKHLILCQHAVGYENGSFSVLNGGLAMVSVPGFPAPVPVTVLVHCLADPAEAPGHHWALSLRDEKGEVLSFPQPDGKRQPMMLEANITVQASPDHPAGVPIPVNMIPTLPLFFEKPGRYEVRCEVDGRTQSEWVTVRGARH